MKSWETLRQTELLLAVQYGAEHPPKPLDAEDLECDDLADAEHWVEVYTELVDFTRSLLETGAATPRSDHAGGASRALMLQARVQELHLAYWVERLNRLRREAGSVVQQPG